MSDAVFQRWPDAAAPRHRSLWLEQALATEPEAERSVQHLEGEHRADVCIVGGGYSGLWTAIRLKELDPALDVALIEADICGAGASGRNGGIANVHVEGLKATDLAPWMWAERKIDTVGIDYGNVEGLRISPSVYTTLEELDRFCEAVEHALANGLPATR